MSPSSTAAFDANFSYSSNSATGFNVTNTIHFNSPYANTFLNAPYFVMTSTYNTNLSYPPGPAWQLNNAYGAASGGTYQTILSYAKRGTDQVYNGWRTDYDGGNGKGAWFVEAADNLGDTPIVVATAGSINSGHNTTFFGIGGQATNGQFEVTPDVGHLVPTVVLHGNANGNNIEEWWKNGGSSAISFITSNGVFSGAGVSVSTVTASSVTVQNITINGTCTGSGCGTGGGSGIVSPGTFTWTNNYGITGSTLNFSTATFTYVSGSTISFSSATFTLVSAATATVGAIQGNGTATGPSTENVNGYSGPILFSTGTPTAGQCAMFASSYTAVGITCATGGGGSPAGPAWSVQSSSAGALGGWANLTNNGSTVTFTGVYTETQTNVSAVTVSTDAVSSGILFQLNNSSMSISSVTVTGLLQATLVSTVSYLTDSNENYEMYVSTAFSLANSSAASTTPNMSLPGMAWYIPASETWGFDCFIQMTGATGGVKMGINGPASSTTGGWVMGPTTTATAFATYAANTLNTVSGTAVCTANTCPGFTYQGWIKSSTTAGTAQIIWAAGTSSDSVTINAGTWCEARRIL